MKNKNICQYCTRQRAITTLSLNACWNQELSYLLTNLMLTSYIQIDVKTARTNLN